VAHADREPSDLIVNVFILTGRVRSATTQPDAHNAAKLTHMRGGEVKQTDSA
jgi:hypothetical protein